MDIPKEKNRYIKNSRLTDKEFIKLLELFLERKNAGDISINLSVNRKTINSYLKAVRIRIAEYCENNYRPETFSQIPISKTFRNKITDERFGTWVKKKMTKKERRLNSGKSKKVLIRMRSDFAIKIINQDKVWTTLIPRWQDADSLRYAKEYTSGRGSWKQWLKFDAISGYGNTKYLIKFNQNKSVEINSFWNDVKSHLKERRGTKDKNFYYHLKEIEFRHNTTNELVRDEMINKLRLDILLKMFFKAPLKLTDRE